MVDQYVPILANTGVLLCTHFASHASCIVVDLPCALHDYLCFRYQRQRRIYMVVDDVRQTYGSVVHDTLQFLLPLVGFPDAVVNLLLLATTNATVHGVVMRVCVCEAQGCPTSTMVFCVVAEVCAFLVLVFVPLCWGPGGPFNRPRYVHNTMSCIDSEDEPPVFDNIQRAGLLTNVFRMARGDCWW